MSNESSTPKASDVTHEQIADRARALWQERGQPAGRDLEHWLDAERELTAGSRHRQGPPTKGGKGAKESAEAEKRLDGLVEPKPSPASRTPRGERL